jgi:lipoprotein-anchoring transpeptidase ErfK/SrfK
MNHIAIRTAYNRQIDGCSWRKIVALKDQVSARRFNRVLRKSEGNTMRTAIFGTALAAVFFLTGAAIEANSQQYEMIDRDTGRSIGHVNKRGLISGSPVPRTTVLFDGSKYEPGTIIVNTAERRLYLVEGDYSAIRYGIGVGRDGFRWYGVHKVSAKREWPGWTPPPEMLKRQPNLPRYMKGGPDNPLGARALYLGSTIYRIHGSNEPETIGEAVSSGCFRMTNEDVIDLYQRVKIGAVVHVIQK